MSPIIYPVIAMLALTALVWLVLFPMLYVLA